MSNRLFFIMAALVVLSSTLISCSRDDVLAVAPHDREQKTPISFNVNIGLLPVPEISTRGKTISYARNSGYTFSDGDCLCVAITGTGSPRTATEEKKLYNYNSSSEKWEYASGGTNNYEYQWYNETESVTLRAWSFGNSTTTETEPSGQLFAVSQTQDSDPDINELLYLKPSARSFAENNGEVAIPLRHQMARIVVNITREGTSGATVSSVKIGDDSDGNRIPIKGTFTPPSATDYGTWATVAYSLENAVHYGVIAAKQETAEPNNEYTYSAVVIPAGTNRYTAGMKLINIKLGTGDAAEAFSYFIPAGGITLKAGMQYNYNITVKNQAISVTGCTITDWGNGTNGGTVTINTLQ